ncbi:MAG TPA: PIN domain-containing protein [Solirubrobacteraceae bacterium]|nr:PIN domain-containing protein [Solirubrobacteraceae bacterium]
MDTNVAVYAYDRDEPARREIARAILADPGEPLVVSTQVLAEFFWVATRRLARPLPEAEAAHVVRALAELSVIGADAELIRSGIALARERQLALWDALIVRAAQVGECARLLSEDLQDGAHFAAVRVENPFARA